MIQNEKINNKGKSNFISSKLKKITIKINLLIFGFINVLRLLENIQTFVPQVKFYV